MINLKELEEFAKVNKVPIILKETKDFFVSFFKEHNISSVLEIGSAIGYSSLFFSSFVSSVTTIEKDIDMIKLCKENLEKYDLAKKVKLIEGDAKLVFDNVSSNTYDLLFIDASKANYRTFFDIYYPLVNDNGFIICDNMNFHNLKSSDLYISKRLKKMLLKLEDFKSYILTNFKSELLDIGDGILVIQKCVI